MHKQKLNVGVFTHDFYPYVGGQGRHIYELYSQNKDDNDINLLIFSPSINDLHNHIQLFPETAKSKLKNIDFSLKLHRNIKKLIKQYDLDIVHIHGGPGGLFFTKKLNIPVVYTCFHTYWQQSHYIKKQSWKKIFTYPEKRGYAKAKKNICISTTSQNILTNNYKINKSQTVYIPCGINKSEFKPINKSCSTNSKDILYVGRLDERKGIKFLVESMRIINSVDAEIRLHIVGDGEYKDKLQQVSSTNKSNIIFHGFISDSKVAKIYEDIKLQIIPSMFEGFGLTVVEAMAKNIPVIATDVDGITDIVHDNENGILVKFGDHQALANAVIGLMNNDKKRSELKNIAFKSIDKFNWKTVYQQTALVYKSLC